MTGCREVKWQLVIGWKGEGKASISEHRDSPPERTSTKTRVGHAEDFCRFYLWENSNHQKHVIGSYPVSALKVQMH